jgi:nucleoside-diphosphate-sugar epimerase
MDYIVADQIVIPYHVGAAIKQHCRRSFPFALAARAKVVHGSYTEPITEETGQHPTVFYGLSKVLGERMCSYFEEMHKIPIVRLRFVWTLEASEILDLFIKAPYKDFLIEEDRSDAVSAYEHVNLHTEKIS